MPLVAFRIPGTHEETGWLHPSWSAVGIHGTVFVPVMKDKVDTPGDMHFGMHGGRYHLKTTDNAVYVSEETYGGLSVTHGFFNPSAPPKEFRDLALSIHTTPQLLHTAVWPMDIALRLSAWFPNKCLLLIGWDADEQRLYEVRNGQIFREMEIIKDYVHPDL